MRDHLIFFLVLWTQCASEYKPTVYIIERYRKNEDMMLHVCMSRAMRLTSRRGEKFQVKTKQLKEKVRACSYWRTAASVILGPVLLVSVQTKISDMDKTFLLKFQKIFLLNHAPGILKRNQFENILLLVSLCHMHNG